MTPLNDIAYELPLGALLCVTILNAVEFGCFFTWFGLVRWAL